MQELVVNGLLAFVALSAAGGRLAAAVRPGGMTGRQRKMLTRILLAAALLLGLQFLPAEASEQG